MISNEAALQEAGALEVFLRQRCGVLATVLRAEQEKNRALGEAILQAETITDLADLQRQVRGQANEEERHG